MKVCLKFTLKWRFILSKELSKHIVPLFHRTMVFTVSNSTKPGKGVVAINRFITSDFTPFFLH